VASERGAGKSICTCIVLTRITLLSAWCYVEKLVMRGIKIDLLKAKKEIFRISDSERRLILAPIMSDARSRIRAERVSVSCRLSSC
jgi:hypothetical protein